MPEEETIDEPIRVVIADDHPPQRAGVRLALEDGGFEVVAEAGDAGGAFAAVHKHRPDVALLDIHMPGSGIAAAGRIAAEVPETAVVMLTVSRNDADLFDALKAGAAGYLLKDMDPDRLPDALRGVLKGEAAMPRALVARLMDEFRVRSSRRKVPLIGRKGAELTSKEWEVLDLLREGLTTAQVAERLFVSPVTVRTHVSAILRKLKVSSREEAIRLLDDPV